MPYDNHLFINVSDLPSGHSVMTMFNLINNVLDVIANGGEYDISQPFISGNEKRQTVIRITVKDPDPDPDCNEDDGEDCTEYTGFFA